MRRRPLTVSEKEARIRARAVNTVWSISRAIRFLWYSGLVVIGFFFVLSLIRYYFGSY